MLLRFDLRFHNDVVKPYKAGHGKTPRWTHGCSYKIDLRAVVLGVVPKPKPCDVQCLPRMEPQTPQRLIAEFHIRDVAAELLPALGYDTTTD